ncbi:unnamed protein product [Brassica oleracea]
MEEPVMVLHLASHKRFRLTRFYQSVNQRHHHRNKDVTITLFWPQSLTGQTLASMGVDSVICSSVHGLFHLVIMGNTHLIVDVTVTSRHVSSKMNQSLVDHHHYVIRSLSSPMLLWRRNITCS